MNHWAVARKMSGCLQRQQCGYECVYSAHAKSRPLARRSSTMRAFASKMRRPAYGPASAVKTPRESTGLTIGSPNLIPVSKSSAPWPGAVWTAPVPVSYST
jgi:hypothetical protein